MDDAIVIGSGYGGAVTALRLAEAGRTVRVIERGAWWVPTSRPERPPGSAPKDWQLRSGHLFPTLREMDERAAWRRLSSPLDGPILVTLTRRPGLYERVDAHRDSPSPMSTIVGAAVGGGSVVNGAMMLRPSAAEVARIFAPEWMSAGELDPAYTKVKTQLGFKTPDEALGTQGVLELLSYGAYRGHLDFHRQAAAAGYALSMIHTAVDWPLILDRLRARERDGKGVVWAARGEYLIGSRDDAKLSVDRGYLPMAIATGRCQVDALTEVVGLVQVDGGWEVSVAALDEHGERGEVRALRARRVFCCAGSMGTTRLLLRAADAVPALRVLRDDGRLGGTWGNNGDVLLRRVGVTVPVPGRMGGPAMWAFTAPPGEAPRPQVRVVHTPGPDVVDWSFVQLAMAPVAPTGRFAREGDDFRLKWDASARSDTLPSSDDIEARARKMLDHLPGSAFAVIGRAAGSTYHPLGGCVLGVATDRRGEVIGCPGLFVNDSALIPGHTAGNNPAWTVAALAEVMVQRALQA
jgi:cholesterol oxidase